jgi:hypothetical protein
MNIKQQTTDKKYIFDPLSTIIKLAVLKNKDIGSKIAIKDNIIYIQENGIFQSIVRYYNGNNKTDIHYLSIPIEFACSKYLTEEMLTQIPDIMILFRAAQDGLNNLMKTYTDYPIIVHCLKYYYSIIETYINELICDKNCILKQKSIVKVKMHKKEKEKEKDKKKENIIEENNEEFNEETNKTIIQETKTELIELYNEELLNKLYTIWTPSKINIVLGMIKYLLLETSPIDYVKCIETFIIPIDNDVFNIIHNDT